MFGVPVVNSTKILYDNASIVNNYFILSSTLNKKNISIAYHFVRCQVAEGVINVPWADTNANLEDAMTKRLTAEKRGDLFGQWTY